MALSQASILQKAGAREIRRYLLPPFNGSGYADGLRVIEEAIQFTRSNSVDCVLLALQWNDERRRNLICERLQILPIPVLLLPDQHVLSIFSRARLTREFTVELQRPPLSPTELALKRALDLVSGERSARRAGTSFLLRWHADQVGIPRTGDLLATTEGVQRSKVHDLQIPNNECPRRRARHSSGS